MKPMNNLYLTKAQLSVAIEHWLNSVQFRHPIIVSDVYWDDNRDELCVELGDIKDIKEAKK